MFAFLVKKIGLINSGKAQSVAWNQEEGWIAVGGEHQPQGQKKGLLKIIRIDDQKAGVQGQAAKLPYDNSLEQHQTRVSRVIWNERYQKLTTCDDQGLIIVWVLHKNDWCEEMVNNRQKSVVTDIKWSPDGFKIGIIYDDGAVIIGSVEGNRLWGRDYNTVRLALIEWSPDSRLLILGTADGQVLIHDQQGNPLNQLKMSCLMNKVDPKLYSVPGLPLSAITWYENGKMYTDDTPPGLLIAYQCGRVQVMKHERDESPMLIDTVMTIYTASWSPNGSIFAVGGCAKEQDEQRAIVQFYSNTGDHLKTLRVASQDQVNSLSFEGDGLRIVMAVAGTIYFANLKLDYKWAYLPSTETLVFAYQRQDRSQFAIIFWDIKRDQRTIRYVKNLIDIKGTQDYCFIVTLLEADTWKLELCNSVGSPLDSKIIGIEPKYSFMTKTHIIISSQDFVYLWQYRNQVQKLTTFEQQSQTGIRKIGREMAWFIDDNPDTSVIYDKEKFQQETTDKQTEEIICAISANQDYLFVGRLNGQIMKFTLPHVSLEQKYFLENRSAILNINCNSTRLTVIDINGNLSVLDLKSTQTLDFEKKDCWQVLWSENDPLTFAMMEKGRLHLVRDLKADDPIPTDAFLIQFSDLSVKGVLLDDIMGSPDGNLKADELIVVYESQTIKDLKEAVKKTSAREMFAIIEKQPSTALWQLLLNKSLEDFEFQIAEKCFLKLDDYYGIQFLKRITDFDDKERQKAEILTYFKRFDEAEQVYKTMDRKDLSVNMRIKIGDYAKVLHLSKDVEGSDALITKTQIELGNNYADQGDWERAAQQYKQANHIEKLIEACFQIEDYSTLDGLIEQLQEGNVYLQDMGERFQLLGMAKQAVKCFEKLGDVKKAIDCAVLLNAWNYAVELAEKNNMMVQIEAVLQQYAAQLLEQRMKLETAELYRKANHNSDAARILSGIAEDLVKSEASPLVVKKLFVMAALEVDLYKKKLYDVTMTAQNNTIAHTLDQLVTNDLQHSADKVLNNPWRGAEAWHFFTLTQRFLYAGDFKSAMKAAIRLQEYELDMDQKKIYSLLALAAYYNKQFKECARAFVKLENLENLTDDEKERYEAIAAIIFVKNPPQDSPSDQMQCPKQTCQNTKLNEYQVFCKECGTIFGVCMVSAKAIVGQKFYTCKACKHKMIDQEVSNRQLKFCSLCHTPIDFNRFGKHHDN